MALGTVGGRPVLASPGSLAGLLAATHSGCKDIGDGLISGRKLNDRCRLAVDLLNLSLIHI